MNEAKQEAKLTLPIEIGKKYVRRDGEVVEIESSAKDGWAWSVQGNSYRADSGTYYVEDEDESERDLIADYVEPTAKADLQGENEALRAIISECASALGNGTGIAPSCSIRFMGYLPAEIRAVVAELKQGGAS